MSTLKSKAMPLSAAERRWLPWLGRTGKLALGWSCWLNRGTYPLAAPQHTAHYLTHPRQASRDFAKARWKIGFLQRAVPLPLPYGKLYLKLKK